MRQTIIVGLLVLVVAVNSDSRLRHLDLRYELPTFERKEQWTARAEFLGRQVVLACGLFPRLPKRPLNPKRVVCYEDDQIVVERVVLETLPGFYLTGNLYRPTAGKGPFPAVLHPHGHVPQEEGRLYERERIRSTSMARLGFIVFAYDMIGYGDHFGLDHRAPETAKEHLWGLSKGALQTWNSVRALDFLFSLPEVDKERIGCCGSSGGGTQTFLIAAVDPRVTVAVPTKMVSAHMQGGCICENPPLLRWDASNPEICGLIAPRPLLLISDDGDWTKETPTYEFPFVRQIYTLLGHPERCANAHFSEGHDFGPLSRVAYYRFALRWLKGLSENEASQVEEPQGPLPSAAQLRVWGPDLPKPDRTASYQDIFNWLRQESQKALENDLPTDQKSLNRFRKIYGPFFQSVLGVRSLVATDIEQELLDETAHEGIRLQKIRLFDKVRKITLGVLLTSGSAGRKEVVLFVGDKGSGIKVGEGKGDFWEFVRALNSQMPVAVIEWSPFFSEEERAKIAYFTTYNRTEVSERLQAITLTQVWLSSQYRKVHLVGWGEGGLLVLLAAAVTSPQGKIVADLANFNPEDDDQFVHRLYIPLLRRVGDFKTALALLAGRSVLLFHPHRQFPMALGRRFYRISGNESRLKVLDQQPSPEKIVSWLTN
ncbi:MAG: acetylxylan esterase [Armatimonadetes bacterium]|nr:acetylxylan esterase [Armatimonadota bacterium]MDW8122838.1 acetylxylan esterase [Armatimonadota bacterium]